MCFTQAITVQQPISFPGVEFLSQEWGRERALTTDARWAVGAKLRFLLLPAAPDLAVSNRTYRPE